MIVIARPTFALSIACLLFAGMARAEGRPRGSSKPSHPEVVLVADLREAGESCGCGQIIRLVREAAQRGVAVREIDPRKEPDAGRAYGIVVAPAVALLDGNGKVTRRLVGEDADTIKALREALSNLKPSAAPKSGT